MRSRDSRAAVDAEVSTPRDQVPCKSGETLAWTVFVVNHPTTRRVVRSAKFTDFCRRSSQGVVDVQAAGAVGLEPATSGVTGSCRAQPRSVPSPSGQPHLQHFSRSLGLHLAWLSQSFH